MGFLYEPGGPAAIQWYDIACFPAKMEFSRPATPVNSIVVWLCFGIEVTFTRARTGPICSGYSFRRHQIHFDNEDISGMGKTVILMDEVHEMGWTVWICVDEFVFYVFITTHVTKPGAGASANISIGRRRYLDCHLDVIYIRASRSERRENWFLETISRSFHSRVMPLSVLMRRKRKQPKAKTTPTRLSTSFPHQTS